MTPGGGSPDPTNYFKRLSNSTFSTVTESIAPAFAALKMKSQAAAIVAEIDSDFAQYLEKYKPANFWAPNPKYFRLRPPENLPFRIEFASYFPETAKTSKAWRNLELAGLDYVLGISKDGSTTRTDPFTATPLKVIQKENEIVIYSVGIDRKDQHAAEYNQNTQLGDISIHLPIRQEAGS